MPTFNLKISFTNEDLQTISATGTSVVVGKPNADGGIPNVSWQVFKPMSLNEVGWVEEYGIYASSSEAVNGVVITQNCQTQLPAAIGQLYTLEDNGIISGPASGGVEGSFELSNKFTGKSYMTVGLYQNATVNGSQIQGHAVTAEAVMQNFTSTMTPHNDIYIWLQSQISHSTIVKSSFSPKTKLSFGGGVTNLNVKYDASTGDFITG